MAGRIPREFIDNLLARTDLVEVIDARVPLKQAGKNYQALCPFHNEKTPSFSVNRDKQFYHCFGCGASGNAISFLMEYERLNFVEAVESLADSLGLEIPREAGGADRRQQESQLLPLYQVQQAAADFYARQLRENPESARARDYLQGRGLTEGIIQQFNLGYAPPGWRSLPASLPAGQLLACGLAVSKDGGSQYDRFRDRIMFPIRDRRGRVIGFGGRVMGEDTPKYLNSPETPTFKKHAEVYGLHEMLASRIKPERIVVVEGYMDVIALFQHGVPYAVATLGTATSADHINLLFRQARELVFCFDGDTAGRNAAWKALQAALPALREGRSLRFLLLPETHDPDSLVRLEGKEGFEERLRKAEPLSDYFFRHWASVLDLTSMEGRSALVSQASPLLATLPEGVFRDMMHAKLRQLSGHGKSDSPKPRRQYAAGQTKRAVPSILRTVLSMLAKNPALFELVSQEARQSLEREEKAGAFAKKLFAAFDEAPAIVTGNLMERFRGEPEFPLLMKLVNEQYFGLEEKQKLADTHDTAEFPSALQQYLAQTRQQRLAYLSGKGLAQLNAEEREELRQLTRRGI